MGAGKSKSGDLQELEELNENFQVDADFFDLSDPEKQKGADAQKR